MRNFQDYPDVLNVDDIRQILSIGRRQAYELISSNQFHSVRAGRRILVLKDIFLKWLAGANNSEI